MRASSMSQLSYCQNLSENPYNIFLRKNILENYTCYTQYLARIYAKSPGGEYNATK